MKKGLLVVNGFIDNSIVSRFNALYEMLVEAFKEYDYDLIIKKNNELLIDINNDYKDDYDFILFWDKDINLAKHLENLGYKVFNSSKSIAICDDKAKTYLALENKNIKMPKTIIAPFTFSNNPYSDFSFVDNAIKELGLPFILKECYGSFGEQVYLLNSKEEIIDKIKDVFPNSFLFQEYIASSFGRDFRIEVVGGNAIGCVERRSNGKDFRSNVLQGGSMNKANPDESFIKMAEDACKIIGLDFAGVDIMIGPKGEPILCEVNSNVHFKTFYKTAGINLASFIAKYVINKISEVPR